MKRKLTQLETERNKTLQPAKQRDELRPKKPEVVEVEHRAPRATERKTPSNLDATAPAASENST